MSDTKNGNIAFERLYWFVVDNAEHFENELGEQIDEWNSHEWSVAAENSTYVMNNISMYEDCDDDMKLEMYDVFDMLAFGVDCDLSDPVYLLLEKRVCLWEYIGAMLKARHQA